MCCMFVCIQYYLTLYLIQGWVSQYTTDCIMVWKMPFFNYHNPGVEGVLQYLTEPRVLSLDLNIAQVEVK